VPHPIRVRVGQPLRFADVPGERAGYERVTAELEAAIRALRAGG
jgi:hypothetical protein